MRKELTEKASEADAASSRIASMQAETSALQARLTQEIADLRTDLQSSAKGSTDVQSTIDQLRSNYSAEKEK